MVNEVSCTDSVSSITNGTGIDSCSNWILSIILVIDLADICSPVQNLLTFTNNIDVRFTELGTTWGENNRHHHHAHHNLPANERLEASASICHQRTYNGASGPRGRGVDTGTAAGALFEGMITEEEKKRQHREDGVEKPSSANSSRTSLKLLLPVFALPFFLMLIFLQKRAPAAASVPHAPTPRPSWSFVVTLIRYSLPYSRTTKPRQYLFFRFVEEGSMKKTVIHPPNASTKRRPDRHNTSAPRPLAHSLLSLSPGLPYSPTEKNLKLRTGTKEKKNHHNTVLYRQTDDGGVEAQTPTITFRNHAHTQPKYRPSNVDTSLLN